MAKRTASDEQRGIGIGLTLPAALHAFVTRVAEKEQRSLAGQIRKVLTDWQAQLERDTTKARV